VAGERESASDKGHGGLEDSIGIETMGGSVGGKVVVEDVDVVEEEDAICFLPRSLRLLADVEGSRKEKEEEVWVREESKLASDEGDGWFEDSCETDTIDEYTGGGGVVDGVDVEEEDCDVCITSLLFSFSCGSAYASSCFLFCNLGSLEKPDSNGEGTG
jgi:hypothetical protein